MSPLVGRGWGLGGGDKRNSRYCNRALSLMFEGTALFPATHHFTVALSLNASCTVNTTVINVVARSAARNQFA